MNFGKLKRIRVLVSLLFFVAIGLAFLNIHDIIPPGVVRYLTLFQIIPSVLQFISIPSILCLGFVSVIVATLLLGRVYCSFLCPLGTLQDIMIYARKKFSRRWKFKFAGSNRIISYPILLIVLLPIIFGSLIGLVFLDPFSVFGKIVTNLIRPVMVVANNGLVAGLESFRIYSITPIEFKGVQFIAVMAAATMLAVVILFSFLYGRLYCTGLCPLGTFLGLLSRYSLLKINIDEKNCKGCGLCEKVCKSSCINTKSRSVDFERCVGCLNCFVVCPTVGMVYKVSKDKVKLLPKDNVVQNEARRTFLLTTGIYLTGLNKFLDEKKKILVYKKSKIPVIRKNPIAPPGSMSISRFKQTCTACHQCVSACPVQVLQPAYLEYGLMGMLLPRLDNIISFCNYECTVCGDICPTGAIKPLSLEDKKLTGIGKAKFIKDNCVVYSQGTDCGACAEHCPTKAVKMVPEDKLRVPFLDNDFCIGCGACEYACPTKPYKAIYVEGELIHKKARIPKKEKIQEQKMEEFPF